MNFYCCLFNLVDKFEMLLYIGEINLICGVYDFQLLWCEILCQVLVRRKQVSFCFGFSRIKNYYRWYLSLKGRFYLFGDVVYYDSCSRFTVVYGGQGMKLQRNNEEFQVKGDIFYVILN